MEGHKDYHAGMFLLPGHLCHSPLIFSLWFHFPLLCSHLNLFSYNALHLHRRTSQLIDPVCDFEAWSFSVNDNSSYTEQYAGSPWLTNSSLYFAVSRADTSNSKNICTYNLSVSVSGVFFSHIRSLVFLFLLSILSSFIKLIYTCLAVYCC